MQMDLGFTIPMAVCLNTRLDYGLVLTWVRDITRTMFLDTVTSNALWMTEKTYLKTQVFSESSWFLIRKPDVCPLQSFTVLKLYWIINQKL